MKRVKSLVLKGVAQIACQSEVTHLGNVGLDKLAHQNAYQLVADQALDNAILKEAAKGNY